MAPRGDELSGGGQHRFLDVGPGDLPVGAPTHSLSSRSQPSAPQPTSKARAPCPSPISNGVLNLSARKSRALAEIYQVLGPGAGSAWRI